MIGYIAAFLAALVTAGIVSVPTDKELKYAFEKANTHDELVKIYEDLSFKTQEMTKIRVYSIEFILLFFLFLHRIEETLSKTY